MTELLDPEIRDVMHRLAERGVSSVEFMTAAASTAVDDREVDIDLATLEVSARRRPILAVAAVLVLIAIVAAAVLASGSSGPRPVEPAGTTLQWRQLAPSPLSPRLGSASVWAGDRWFIWGGSATADESRSYPGDGATYDPASDRWALVPDGPLSGRTLADAVWTGGEVVIGGGWSGTGDSTRPDLAAYDPATGTWRALADAPGPISRLEMVDGVVVATVAWNERMSLASYDPGDDSWSTPVAADLTVGPAPSFESRQHYATLGGDRYVAGDNRLYRNVFGRDPLYELSDVLQFRSILATERELLVVGQGAVGDNRDDRRTVVRYDPATDRSRIFEVARSDPGIATTTLAGNTVALVPNLSGDTVELFDLGTNRWIDAPEAPVAVGRLEPAVVWTGRELLIWGGATQVEAEAPLAETATGAALRIDDLSPPELVDEWREIAPSPLSPREEHVAVWTGTEMIVWGGRFQGGGTVVENEDGSVSVSGSAREGDRLTGLRDGAAYDPSTDTWRRIADAPFEGDYLHRAVWTGTEMIVVGRDRLVEEPDAAAYDPATDSWRTITAPPIDRGLHEFELLMIDNGTLLLFSGSQNNATTAARVDAYDIDADRWTPRAIFSGVTRINEAVVVGDEVWATGEERQADGSVVTIDLRSTNRGESWGWSPFGFTPSPDSTTGVWIAEVDGDLVTVAGDRRTDAVTTFWDINADGTPLVGGNSVRSTTETARSLPNTGFDFLEQIDPVVTDDGALIIVGVLTESIRRGPDGGWRSIGDPPVSVSFGHSGVWTGTDLIIWGGRADENGGSSVATGAAYRPG
jgi:hypothetical protein